MPTLIVQSSPSDSDSVRCEIPDDLDVMDDDAFFAFCQANETLRIERTATGEIEVMTPSGWETGHRNVEIIRQLAEWTAQDGSGYAGDSSAGFILPNRAERAPDASWILKSRVDTVSKERREKFLPLAPDFVIELRSPSGRLAVLQGKMEEYVANGVRLGWLIDPFEKTVHVYAADSSPEILPNPATVAGSGPIQGFVLELSRIFA